MIEYAEIESLFFEECNSLAKGGEGKVARYCGSSKDNLYAILSQIQAPTWSKVVHYVEINESKYNHTEMKDLLKIYIRTYYLKDNPAFFKNINEIVNIINKFVPTDVIHDNTYDLSAFPCVSCGQVPETEHELVTYRDIPNIDVPMCQHCIDEGTKPDKELIINMLAIYSNKWQTLYHKSRNYEEREVIYEESIYNG